jgi:cellulose synthase/poly-beta-1,6-N-acetylglucosamine synthase-like glycosyltransferase
MPGMLVAMIHFAFSLIPHLIRTQACIFFNLLIYLLMELNFDRASTLVFDVLINILPVLFQLRKIHETRPKTMLP